MTLGLVLLTVEVLAPAARKLWKRWIAEEDRRSHKTRVDLGRRPRGD